MECHSTHIAESGMATTQCQTKPDNEIHWTKRRRYSELGSYALGKIAELAQQ